MHPEPRRTSGAFTSPARGRHAVVTENRPAIRVRFAPTMASRDREQFFECTFESGRNEYQFHCRAWNADEAEDRFRTLLASDGVLDQGTLLVRDLRGQVRRRGDYGASPERR
jgi:hypothetical protein